MRGYVRYIPQYEPGIGFLRAAQATTTANDINAEQYILSTLRDIVDGDLSVFSSSVSSDSKLSSSSSAGGVNAKPMAMLVVIEAAHIRNEYLNPSVSIAISNNKVTTFIKEVSSRLGLHYNFTFNKWRWKNMLSR